jgi:hypothetical protein
MEVEGEDTHSPEGPNTQIQLRLEHVLQFVNRAREMLHANQPASMEFVSTGFAIRFQDGQVIPLIVGSDVQATGGVGGEIPVTKPDTRLEHGIAPARSWGVTGDK